MSLARFIFKSSKLKVERPLKLVDGVSRVVYKLRGFFHCLANLSIVPLTLSFLVSSLFAVMIHSIYSFLLVKDRVLKNSSRFLFLLNASKNRSAGELILSSNLHNRKSVGPWVFLLSSYLPLFLILIQMLTRCHRKRSG